MRAPRGVLAMDARATMSSRGATLAYTVPRVRIDAMSAKEFADTFLTRGAPVILVDAERRVVPTWTARELAAKYGNVVVPLDGGERRVALEAFVQSFANEDKGGAGASTRDGYARNLHASEYFPEEARALRLPDALGENKLRDPSATPGVNERWRDWFEVFICARNDSLARFPFVHRDTCGVHAASYQIEGSKQFTLFPPSEPAEVMYAQSSAGGTGNRSMIPDIDAPEVYEKYPRFARARRLDIDVHPGEILVIPSNWWHTAKPLPSASGDDASMACISVAASFVDDSICERFLDLHGEFRAMQSLLAVGAARMT